MSEKEFTNCPICGGDLKEERQDRPYLKGAKLNVTLKDIQVFTCQSCEEEFDSIPRMEELHKTLAIEMATQPNRLTGPEIRFLRTHLGWSGKDFAKTLGVTAESVSRWENDKEKMGTTSERLLRVMVLRLKPVEEYPTEKIAELGLADGPMESLDLLDKDGSWETKRAA